MRYAHTDVSVWFVVGLVAVTVLLALITRLISQRRDRKNASKPRLQDPDRGGSGYTPVARVPTPEATPSQPDIDRHELWLLGFSAPRAVHAGADPFEWDLGPAFADASWRTSADRAERTLRFATSAAERAAAAVDAAWWIRVGLAGGQISIDEARERTRAIADAVRADAGDWIRFGELLGEREGLTPPWQLYRPGASWATPGWPAR